MQIVYSMLVNATFKVVVDIILCHLKRDDLVTVTKAFLATYETLYVKLWAQNSCHAIYIAHVLISKKECIHKYFVATLATFQLSGDPK